MEEKISVAEISRLREAAEEERKSTTLLCKRLNSRRQVN